MQIKISLSYIIEFLLLTIIMLELHETIHILVGRFICGCWGARDFNVWSLCVECEKTHRFSWVATLAGPLFSFVIMWLGTFWLSHPNSNIKAFGFSIIFANIPFGRISEVMKGAGDEMAVTRHLLKNHFTLTQMILICSVFILALGLPPIIKAFRILTNKNSWLYIIGFLTLPILFILVYILIGMNSLLNSGFLSTTGVMGTPLLISLHSVMAIFFFLFFHKKIFLLNKNKYQ
jgi:hypothetical protein